jgi:hypothetical protein
METPGSALVNADARAEVAASRARIDTASDDTRQRIDETCTTEPGKLRDRVHPEVDTVGRRDPFAVRRGRRTRAVEPPLRLRPVCSAGHPKFEDEVRDQVVGPGDSRA